MSSEFSYPQSDIDAIYKVLRERRDMRHFIDKPIAPALLQRLLAAAHLAPSVGLMQPWRFIRITDKRLKMAIKGIVEQERNITAELMDERKEAFLTLKVEGILECAELLVVALPEGREKHIFGRRTMPDMDLASASCAIQNMWLAARAEGIGLGWVSLFDPLSLATLLEMPSDSRPIAILCIGHVEKFYAQPMLIEQNWAEPIALQQFVFENSWANKNS